MSNVKETIKSYGYTVEEVEDYLHELREGGTMNMFGSGPYLESRFGFDRKDVKAIVVTYVTEGLTDREVA